MSRNKVVSVYGASVKNCCAEARRILGIGLVVSREVLRSGGEDGLWRVTLMDGTVVECTLVKRARTQVLDVINA